MQLHTSSITTVEMTSPETSGTLEQRFALFGAWPCCSRWRC
jgi:hypothetical protein